MLKKTFSHIKGVGDKAEQTIWQNNIADWDAFLSAEILPLSKTKITHISQELSQSQIAFNCKDHQYFSQRLASKHHWRMFNTFKDSCVYLDIETSGENFHNDDITTIATYDGQKIRHYVNGQNLNQFVEDIQAYDIVITYNGKCFDVPFINRFFNIELKHSHIDLRFVLKSLGYSGGLKGCEKQFGLSRDDLDGVDGFFAILLWREYKRTNNPRVLETLLAYNIEDVVNLEYLMHQAYNLKIREFPILGKEPLKIPERPQVPFQPDKAVIKKLLSYSHFY